MTDVVMPQMGESIVEGTLTKWLKKPGERVERDEPLFEISTDKVDTEIPSPAAGTLAEVLVEEGKTVGINTVVARIDEGGGAAAAPKPAAARADPPPLRRRRRLPPQPLPRAAPRRGRPAPPRRQRAPVEAREPRAAVSAGAQDGAREQYRSVAGEGHRRRRPHHQAGRGGLPGADTSRCPARRRPAPGSAPASSPRGSARRAAAMAPAAARRHRPRRASSR